MNIIKKPIDFINKRNWIVSALLSIVIFTLAVWGVEDFNQFLLFDDEFGYWTGSAYLTGTDWTSVASGIPYYSYGYGFLILTPIRLLFNSAPMMYHAAIVANSLLLVGSFWIARYVTKQLFPNVNWLFRDMVCFLCQVYPAYLVFSHIAWAECCLVFVFWVFVWLSLRVINKPSVWNHIGIALSTVVLYTVHQRTVAVIIATAMIMVWLFIVERERRKDIIVYGVSLAAFLFVHSLIKADLLNKYYHYNTSQNSLFAIIALGITMAACLVFVDKKRRRIILIMGSVVVALFLVYVFFKIGVSESYANNSKVSVNDFSGQFGKLKGILTWDGFVSLLKSMLGKWFYFTMSTFMMIWWAADFMLGKLFSYGEEVISKKKKHQLHKMYSDISVWYIWMFLAFLGNFLVAAIYMNGVTRNDNLVYGRYTEYMLGIYIIIGAIAFMQDRKWWSKTIIYVGIACFSGWICQGILDELGLTSYQAYHSVYTSLFLTKGVPPYEDIYRFTAFAVITSLIVIGLLKVKIWTKVAWLPKILLPIPMVILFCYISYSIVFGTVLEKQSLRVINIQNIVNWLENIDNGENHKVYFCVDTESRYWSESFQFLLQETPLTLINSGNINPEEEAFYITGDDFVNSDGYGERYYCIKKSYQFALSVNEGTELATRARQIKGE